MKWNLFLLWVALSVTAATHAQSNETKCFQAESESFASVTKLASYNSLRDGQLMADINIKKNEIDWVPNTVKSTCSIQQIGTHNYRGIYLVTWLEPKPLKNPQEKHPKPFDRAILAIADGHENLKPFIYFEGDQILHFEPIFESNPGLPFSLMIHVELSGHAVPESTYSFIFNKDGPVLTETHFYSRGYAETTRYDKTGKVTSTKHVRSKGEEIKPASK